MDIDKISNRAVEIYMTTGHGIKESIAKAEYEYLNENYKFKLVVDYGEVGDLSTKNL
jgi:hypothetical protein